MHSVGSFLTVDDENIVDRFSNVVTSLSTRDARDLFKETTWRWFVFDEGTTVEHVMRHAPARGFLCFIRVF